MITSPVFVVGCDRSGTTLLRLMLNEHSRIAIPYESHFLADLIATGPPAVDLENDRSLRQLFVGILDTWHVQQWAIDREAVWQRMLDSDRTLPPVLGAFFEVFMESQSKSRWGDKTPQHVLCMPELRAIFPAARFIHVIRDGRDVAASLQRVPWFHGNIVTAADFWRERVEKGRNDGKRIGDAYLEVRYESLVSEPVATLERVCQHIGEEFETGMLRYYESAERNMPEAVMGSWQDLNRRQVTSSRVGRWRSELTERQVELFETVAGSTLEELGYPPSQAESHRPRNRLSVLALRAPVWARRKLGDAARWLAPGLMRRRKGWS